MSDFFTQTQIQNWLNGPYDEATKQEIRRLQKESPQTLADVFFKKLSFGTGGLRAQMGIGTNRLNIYTIQTATQALANYIKQNSKPDSDASVFIGYDVRHFSKEFALMTARVLAGNGIRVYLTDEICPTPLVSFGCLHFKCQAAVMITASHNPPEYNGYKVYWSDGGQIVAPHDQAISQELDREIPLESILLAPMDSPLIQKVRRELDQLYLKELSKLRLYKDLPALQLLYTPLHGTGIRIIPEALKSWGFSCTLVDAQKTPDGNFTNAPSPNPEETSALQLGCEELVREQGDLLIATDPDADRMGIAVLHQGVAVRLTGHQIASICLDHICKALQSRGELTPQSSFIKTIVTTELFRKIVDFYGGQCFDVLTGFKFIAAQIEDWEKHQKPNRYVFGGEESYGSLFGTFVRDKDAISSSCLIAEAASVAKAKNQTLVDHLHELYRRHGVHQESLTTLSFPDSQAGLEAMKHLMDNLRKHPPSQIGDLKVQSFEDYLLKTPSHLPSQIPLPPSNVLRFWLENGSKLVIRPSGTEPKIKIYAEVVEKEGDPCHVKQQLTQLVDSFKKVYKLKNTL